MPLLTLLAKPTHFSADFFGAVMPGLEDLYREIILDHYRNPRNRGELDSPPAVRAEGFNPLCGDEVVVYLDVDNGVIDDLKVSGQGCSISQSSASMMSAAVKGKTLAQARSTIRAFRAMMSLHGQQLDGGADGAGGRAPPAWTTKPAAAPRWQPTKESPWATSKRSRA